MKVYYFLILGGLWLSTRKTGARAAHISYVHLLSDAEGAPFALLLNTRKTGHPALIQSEVLCPIPDSRGARSANIRGL
jgi:hypothetical protein